MDAPEWQHLANVQVDLVQPEQQGFTLSGQGGDRAEYRIGVHFDMPLDGRTRAVLGELLAQSEISIARRLPVALMTPPARPGRSRRRRITAD